MDIQLIKLMGRTLAVVLPITIFLLYKKDQQDKKKVNSRYRKIKNNSYLIRLYWVLSSVPFMRGYVDKIRRRYEMLYPGEPKVIIKETMISALFTWGLCGFFIWFVLHSKFNFNNTAVAIISVFVVNTEVIAFLLMRSEIKLLEEIAVFLSNVRHNYYIKMMVDDAILLSMDGVSYQMKAHAQKLYEVVLATNIKEEVENYNASMSNKYLKMFLALCVNVIEFTDKKVNGRYLFTTNLENLKKEVDIEILKQKKLRFLFSGLTIATIGVIIPIDVIKDYCISIMPELDTFYYGGAGITYVIVTLILTMMIYLLNNRLKETKHINIKNYSYLKRLEKIRIVKRILENYTERHYSKTLKLRDTLKRIGETISPRQLLLQRILLSISFFIISISCIFYIHENNRLLVTTKISNITVFTNTVNITRQKEVSDTILQYVNKFKKDDKITYEIILNMVKEDNNLYNTGAVKAIADEVHNRITAYRDEYFKYYELLICMAIAVIAYYIPYWMIYYRRKILQMSMEDEVTQFNSIIFMLMYNSHITVKDLLEELELFSVVFKQTIQECLNDYGSGDIEALERMKEREVFLPFRRMVDNLIRCDTIAIDKAFDEISSDRENYHERRKLENEISIQRRVDIATPLAWIPTGLVMMYLTLPLIIASVSELGSFKDMMNSL
jgi:hypothetical protein